MAKLEDHLKNISLDSSDAIMIAASDDRFDRTCRSVDHDLYEKYISKISRSVFVKNDIYTAISKIA